VITSSAAYGLVPAISMKGICLAIEMGLQPIRTHHTLSESIGMAAEIFE
jgi:hypothetical protein